MFYTSITFIDWQSAVNKGSLADVPNNKIDEDIESILSESSLSEEKENIPRFKYATTGRKPNAPKR